jgi:hypothetical protein
MLGAHVRREYFQPELARLAEAARSLNPGISFYTLRMGDRAVGQATSALDTVADGFELEDLMALELPALGQTGTAVARTFVKLDPSLFMERFSFSLDSEVGRFEAEGEVAGDSLLTVTIRSQGSEQTLDFRLPTPPVFSAVVPIRVAMAGQLEVGAAVDLPVFDPTTLSTRRVEVRVLEHDTLVVPDSVVRAPGGRWEPASWDSIPAWRIAELFGGVSVESWVDDDGRVLQASSALGFSMEKTEYELAQQAQDDAAGRLASAVDEDVVLSTAIRSDVDLGDVGGWEELRFVLSGVDLSGFDLDGGRQQLRGDTLIVRREQFDRIQAGYRLPYPSMDLREALEPEPLIQSADPRIVRAAETVTSRGAYWRLDPKRVAEELTYHVARYVEDAVTFSVPSALQVLDSRRGDCNEHTVLYVALARALGLPARTAVGLVYLDGSFFYHAWPEVWLGGGWVAVDPTFDQAPADAAHIRFVIGGLAQQVEIVRLIGRLDIEVVSASQPRTP